MDVTFCMQKGGTVFHNIVFKLNIPCQLQSFILVLQLNLRNLWSWWTFFDFSGGCFIAHSIITQSKPKNTNTHKEKKKEKTELPLCDSNQVWESCSYMKLIIYETRGCKKTSLLFLDWKRGFYISNSIQTRTLKNGEISAGNQSRSTL